MGMLFEFLLDIFSDGEQWARNVTIHLADERGTRK